MRNFIAEALHKEFKPITDLVHRKNSEALIKSHPFKLQVRRSCKINVVATHLFGNYVESLRVQKLRSKR